MNTDAEIIKIVQAFIDGKRIELLDFAVSKHWEIDYDAGNWNFQQYEYRIYDCHRANKELWESDVKYQNIEDWKCRYTDQQTFKPITTNPTWENSLEYLYSPLSKEKKKVVYVSSNGLQRITRLLTKQDDCNEWIKDEGDTYYRKSSEWGNLLPKEEPTPKFTNEYGDKGCSEADMAVINEFRGIPKEDTECVNHVYGEYHSHCLNCDLPRDKPKERLWKRKDGMAAKLSFERPSGNWEEVDTSDPDSCLHNIAERMDNVSNSEAMKMALAYCNEEEYVPPAEFKLASGSGSNYPEEKPESLEFDEARRAYEKGQEATTGYCKDCGKYTYYSIDEHICDATVVGKPKTVKMFMWVNKSNHKLIWSNGQQDCGWYKTNCFYTVEVEG